MLLIEKKIPQNGHIVFFGLNDFQVFNDFYKACSFASKLENFIKFVEMSDGVEKNVIESKEKLKALSTKYLNNYLVYHNFVNFTKETNLEKEQILFKHILETNCLVKSANIVDRPAVPLLVA